MAFKKHVGAALCACIVLLSAGMALGRYSALRAGAVIATGGSLSGTLAPLETRAAERVRAEDSVKLDINTADAATLTELPGIGPALAGRIVEYREANGEFESIEEVMAVRGIGESVFSKIRDYIRVD